MLAAGERREKNGEGRIAFTQSGRRTRNYGSYLRYKNINTKIKYVQKKWLEHLK
jgi:hypothetical protein